MAAAAAERWRLYSSAAAKRSVASERSPLAALPLALRGPGRCAGAAAGRGGPLLLKPPPAREPARQAAGCEHACITAESMGQACHVGRHYWLWLNIPCHVKCVCVEMHLRLAKADLH